MKPSVGKLITAALAIEDESAQDAGAMGFMARAMVQATLPHKRVEGNEFIRRNGNFTLTMIAPTETGLPYGSVPRLLLAWLTTEAVKTRSRELELGASMSGFMAELGMSRTGGAKGDIIRLKDQTERLFDTTIYASYKDGEKTTRLKRSITDDSVLWWDDKKPNQTALWRSTVTLSEPFFHEITEQPIPVDMRALRALKKSSLALDIYTTLTYRASYAKRASTIPWKKLAEQLGSNYKLVRQFKAAFVAELRKVAAVYPAAQFDVTEAGLVLKPSLTHVTRRSVQR